MTESEPLTFETKAGTLTVLAQGDDVLLFEAGELMFNGVPHTLHQHLYNRGPQGWITHDERTERYTGYFGLRRADVFGDASDSAAKKCRKLLAEVAVQVPADVLELAQAQRRVADLVERRTQIMELRRAIDALNGEVAALEAGGRVQYLTQSYTSGYSEAVPCVVRTDGSIHGAALKVDIKRTRLGDR